MEPFVLGPNIEMTYSSNNEEAHQGVVVLSGF
jgi:hypothetical protein